jgi:hypothetical protein
MENSANEGIFSSQDFETSPVVATLGEGRFARYSLCDHVLKSYNNYALLIGFDV